MFIRDGAIFIADSHFNTKRDTLIKFLSMIDKGDIKTTQLFLMGDIFDFLTSVNKYFVEENKNLINLINKLSLQISIVYFEGNHDFLLKSLFVNLKIITREQQPMYININDKKVALSHGDIYSSVTYDIFSYIFRSNIFLNILELCDINYIISKYFDKKLQNKYICNKQNNFQDFIKKRKKLYDVDLIIEGHFHQGHIDKNYINIPSFACANKYMLYKNNQFSFNIL